MKIFDKPKGSDEGNYTPMKVNRYIQKQLNEFIQQTKDDMKRHDETKKSVRDITR